MGSLRCRGRDTRLGLPAPTVLQYNQAGPRRDDLFGEKVHTIPSLTAKALLARQIFFPVLMSGK
jgi:hypothetical protein